VTWEREYQAIQERAAHAERLRRLRTAMLDLVAEWMGRAEAAPNRMAGRYVLRCADELRALAEKP
jgi:hypothetical protein